MKAAFAAGCFWGIEAGFKELGITTTVGYMDGHTKNPTYKQVCTGNIGHAETVLIEYDPKILPYDILLKLFGRIHDYTQINRQGPDVRSQYRSVIFYYDAEQKIKAVKSRPIDAVTEVVPATEFWPTEEYHQDYFEKH